MTDDADSSDRLGPRNVSSLLSWNTTDALLVYSDAGYSGTHIVKGVRLDCGNAFSTGPNEQREAPVGPQICASVERPRHISGSVVLVVAAAILLLSGRLPTESARYRSRYRMPLNQRIALMRSKRR